MNTKIQEGIDTLVKLFTKKIGEVGIYLGAELVLTFLAMIPLMVIGGFSILSMGGGGIGNLTGLFSPEMFQGGRISLEGLGEMLSFLGPIIAGGLITLALIVLVVMPIMAILRATLFTLSSDNFNENLNLMIKNVLGKYGRMLGLFLLIGLAYIVIGIGLGIVMFILGLIFGLLGFVGVVLLYLILIVVGIGLLFIVLPVIVFAPFDAALTDKPVMACLMDAFKANAYRLPLLLVAIVFGIIGWIVSLIFGFIPIPFLAGIVTSAVTLAQFCFVFPYYKEYSGLA